MADVCVRACARFVLRLRLSVALTFRIPAALPLPRKCSPCAVPLPTPHHLQRITRKLVKDIERDGPEDEDEDSM